MAILALYYYRLLRWLTGPFTVKTETINDPSNAPTVSYLQLGTDYIDIRMHSKRYRLIYHRWYIPDKDRVVYCFWAETSSDDPTVKAVASERVYIPDVAYPFISEAARVKMMTLVYSKILETRLINAQRR